jgi:hypothetical protein
MRCSSENAETKSAASSVGSNRKSCVAAQEIRKQERHEMSLRVAQAKLESKQQHKIASEPDFQTVAGTELAASIGGAA